jgi:hypothetical protein
MSAPSIAENRELVDRTARALEDRSLEPADLRRLLSRASRQRGIDAGGVFRALGLLTAFAGVAFLYIINHHSLSDRAQELTPFVFPAVLLVMAVVLDRVRRPAWEVELAAIVGDISLAVTFVAASGAWGRSRDYGLAAAVISLVVSLVMYSALRLVRLTTWAAAASIVAITTFGVAGDSPRSVAHVFLVQAIIAAVVGFALLRQSRPVAAQALYLATLLALVAGFVGVVADAFGQSSSSVSVWALALFVTTLAALATAATVELTGLLWLGALGALLTLAAVAEPSRSDTHWAYVMMVIGVVLAFAGAFIHHARRPPRAFAEQD